MRKIYYGSGAMGITITYYVKVYDQRMKKIALESYLEYRPSMSNAKLYKFFNGITLEELNNHRVQPLVNTVIDLLQSKKII